VTTEIPSVEEILTTIRESGGRVTTAKRALLEVLARTENHLTADDLTTIIQSSAPDVSPSTIYRNLEELEELGVVVHTHFGRSAAVYHLAGPDHGHLTCEQCGGTFEVPSAMFEEIARAAKRDFDFDVDRHHLAISGFCSYCQSR
jgi:Fur family ferric uptake transcriptional regulator